jgi:nicotinamidase-related amidase
VKTVNGIAVFSELHEMVAPRHTALIVVDVQNDLVLPEGWFARNGKDVSRTADIIPRVAELVAAARGAGALPVFMEQTTLPNNASDPPAWLYFKTRDGRQRTDYAQRGTWGQRTVDALRLADDDIRIEKFRPSAFHDTALHDVLQARGIKSVLVCGTITQGCVQATVMDSSFHNYYTVLVEDCVQSYSPELHENALTFMRSRYDTTTVAQLRAIWGRAQHRSARHDMEAESA